MTALRDALALVAKSSTKGDMLAQAVTKPQARTLAQGDRFKMHPDTCTSQHEADAVWLVIRVSPGCAMVRALNTRTVVIKDQKRGIELGSYNDTLSSRMLPIIVSKGITAARLLDEYHAIDQAQLDRERRALLTPAVSK